jgi:hypothetical protein
MKRKRGKKRKGKRKRKKKSCKSFCKNKSKVYPIELLSTSRKARWAFFLEPQT